MRLIRYVSASGIASRRKSEAIIRTGRVKVNGLPNTNPFYQLQANDVVSFDNRKILPPDETCMIVLNKPEGVITTVEDTHERPTVMDILKKKERLFPVGRLDKDTTGVLLLTNDGYLAYQLTHPKFEIEKVYIVTLDKPFHIDDSSKIESGIDIGNGETGSGRILSHERISMERLEGRRGAKVKISLSHGKKREVRRIFNALGYEIVALHRESFAGVTVNSLDYGEWRKLTAVEIEEMSKYRETSS